MLFIVGEFELVDGLMVKDFVEGLDGGCFALLFYLFLLAELLVFGLNMFICCLL
jgi:hypothetical protein